MSVSAISASASPAWNKLLSAAETATSHSLGKSNPTGCNPPADIKRAASQFEAIILRQLLTPTIEPLMNGGLGGAGGSGGGVYGYMLTDVLADSLSKGGGLGLTQMLSRQLTPRGLPPEEPAVPSADSSSAASPSPSLS